MALRTYRFLRLGVVGVFAILATAVLKQAFSANPDCIQNSISAYYYTPVRAVFVGALVTLGFAMIVLWGKSAWEDSLLNLAGMLAPVVAFVPTGQSNLCSIKDSEGGKVSPEEKQAVLDASHAATVNNMFSYLVVLFIALAALAAVGVVAHVWTHWPAIVEHKKSYWLSLAAAAVLWVVGAVAYNQDGREWLFNEAHWWSAVFMFVFITGAIVAVGIDKYTENTALGEPRERGWAWTYWLLALAMVVVTGIVFAAAQLQGKGAGHDLYSHKVFWIEVSMISGVIVFWILQTWDRWGEGAPPVTEEEREEKEAKVAAVAAAGPREAP